jgi:hypothetical protein
MIIFDPTVGDRIFSILEQMIACANENGDSVGANINGVDLVVQPGDVLEAAASSYYQEKFRRDAASRESREGKRATADAERHLRVAERQMKKAMGELDTLDFTSFPAVINWLERVCDPSDHIGVHTKVVKIVLTFRDHGFEASVNCGSDFNAEDEENYARWLIGSALECLLHVGAMHRSFHQFAEEWRSKFGHVRP